MTVCCQGFLFPSVVIGETRIKKGSCHITSWSLCFTNHFLKTKSGHMGLRLCKDLQAEVGVLLTSASQRLLPASPYSGVYLVHVQRDEAHVRASGCVSKQHGFGTCVAESEIVLHGDGMRRKVCRVSRHAALCTSFYNCMFTLLFFFSFFMHAESSITFLCCNVDLIKIFIGFYKIISYMLFPGALQGGGKAGERKREDSILRMRWRRKVFYFTPK